MKMSIRFFLLSVSIVGNIDIGQAQEIGVSLGYGTFKMEDLKRMNFEFTTQTSIPVKQVSDFPGFIIPSVNVFFTVSEKFKIGGQISLASTGSRVTYSDYSGRFDFDQELYAIDAAAIPSYVVSANSKNIITLDAKLGCSFTSHDLITRWQILDESGGSKESFKAMNIFIEPGIKYARHLGNTPLLLSIRGGYNVNIHKGKLYSDEDEDAYLMYGTLTMHADWSGLRAEVGLSYILGKGRQKKIASNGVLPPSR